MNKVCLGDVAFEHKETCKGSKNNYPVVGLEHLVPEEVTLSLWDEGSDNTFTKVFRKGNVLFGRRRAYLKKAAVAPFDGICSGDITVIEANADKIVPELLPFIIQNDALFDFAIEKSAGSLSPRVKWEHLREFEFELPEISKQKQLAEVLWAMDTTKKTYQNLIKSTDELVKSQFIEMFGGYSLRNKQSDWVKISSVAEIVGGSTPKTENAEYWGGKHNWITPAEISDDSFIVYKTQRTLTGAGVKSCSLRLLPIGTVLLSSRAPIGKVAITGVEMYCNQGFKNLICGQSLNSIYIYYLLKFNSEYLNSLGRGATFKEISKSIVDNIAIPVPEIELQNRFAAFVEQTDKSKVLMERCIFLVNTLRKVEKTKGICYNIASKEVV